MTWAELRSLRRKRSLLQRCPMRVEWVDLWEHIALGEFACSVNDQSIAGHALWKLHARIRLRDSPFIIQELSSEGRYVEASTSRTKTSNRRGQRDKALCQSAFAKVLCRSLGHRHGWSFAKKSCPVRMTTSLLDLSYCRLLECY
jgi:hypothetical protein